MIVKGTAQTMTRGDSESITVSVDNRPFVDGDQVEMTIRKMPGVAGQDSVAFHKSVTEFEDGKAIIGFYPQETSGMDFGMYYYDIQLTMADGTVTTIIKPSAFIIDKEVTYGDFTGQN